MSVEVVIPWRGGCPHRERALKWVRARYAEKHPGWQLTVAEAPPGPWVKALAACPAIEASDAETVVLADGDIWTDGLAAAVQAVESGSPWAIPHYTLHRLTETGTAAMLAGQPWRGQPLEQRPYPGIPGGGIVVAPRATHVRAPLDPRFVGWGQEDVAHNLALRTLAGEPWRSEADLLHCWHPPQRRRTRERGSDENWRLRHEYLKALEDPDRMRRLIEEGRDALTAPEPAGHDHPAVTVD